MQRQQRVKGSFRDPNGFLFWRDGEIYRQVNRRYQRNYDLLISSGLYASLSGKGLLISHDTVETSLDENDEVYRIIKPELIDYISYPYEWCFSQLKDAALLTLTIQQEALGHGMTLKDASAYNIQFRGVKPVFIDSLSFEQYESGPWFAYKQFCQHFLAPLALKSKTDRRLSQLLRTNIDGVPLDLASKLLPLRSWFSFSLLAHIHLHARAQAKYADSARSADGSATAARNMSKARLVALIDQLISAVKGMKPIHEKTEWGDYYADTNYRDKAMQHKTKLIESMLSGLERKNMTVIDMGANNGQFSRVALPFAKHVISQDIDEIAVEKNYLTSKASKEYSSQLPLVQDLTNPSPAIGWANSERLGLMQRGRVDVIMALALIHHIAIVNNVPLIEVARFFHQQADYLIIEFVPKSDSQVMRMLTTREDIFIDYYQDDFEQQFRQFFLIEKSEPVDQSERILYLMKARNDINA
jgi:hypothetical protein